MGRPTPNRDRDDAHGGGGRDGDLACGVPPRAWRSSR